MKKTILFFIIAFFNNILYSQQKIEYQYDVFGNRTLRKIVEIKLNENNFNKQDSIFNIKEIVYTDSNIFYNINNNVDLTNISIYPNPTKGTINVEIKTIKSEKIRIDIYNQTSQRVLESFTNIENFKVINLSSYPAGVYIIIINTTNYTYKQKIIKL